MRTTLPFLVALFTFSMGCQERPNPPTPDAPQPSSVGTDPSDDGDAPSIPPQPLLIREAHMSVEVDDAEDALGELARIADAAEGFVLESDVRLDGEQRAARAVIRVPAHRFDDVIGRIRELAGVIEDQTVTTTDVTEEYVDLEARLRVKGALEARLLELLGTAGSTTTTLEVERALADVREDIERLEGRRQYLSRRVELSTITVDLHEGTSTLARLGQALAIGKEVFFYLGYAGIILITGFAPFILALIVLLFAIRALSRWRRRRTADVLPSGAPHSS